MGRMSRQKGKRGEREFAAFLCSLGVEARRGVQFHGGPDSPDVVSSLPVHWEVKRVERLDLHGSLKQAVDEAAPGKMPVVAHRKNNGDWIAVLNMKDLIPLIVRAGSR